MNPTSVQRHNAELARARRVWASKPILRRAYADLRARLIPHVRRDLHGTLLEIGSGLGAMKETFPEVVTTDLFANPGIDHVASAYDLPVADRSLSHLLMVDVWHHLERPAAFLQEAARALAPNGRILMIEPDLSLAGRWVYGPLHPEPIGRPSQVTLDPTPPRQSAYVAYQGLAHWCFVSQKLSFWTNDWRLCHTQRFACAAYWATGGFSRAQLIRERGYQTLQKLDQTLSRLPAVFSGRLLVVLERK